MTTEQVKRCDGCNHGKQAGKDFFGAGSIICRRYPQELRKNADDCCGEHCEKEKEHTRLDIRPYPKKK